jgi:hypothetical protein
MAGSSLVELIRLLSGQEQAMEELMAALTEEERCIASADLASLDRSGRRKEAAIACLMQLKSACIDLMVQIGAARGASETRSLSPLISAMSAAEQMEVRPLQQRLVWLAVVLERQLELNRGMLVNSLDLVRSSMALFGRLLGGFDTYGARGQVSRCKVWGSILHREI